MKHIFLEESTLLNIESDRAGRSNKKGSLWHQAAAEDLAGSYECSQAFLRSGSPTISSANCLQRSGHAHSNSPMKRVGGGVILTSYFSHSLGLHILNRENVCQITTYDEGIPGSSSTL